MPRKVRFFLPNVPVQIVQHGNKQNNVFDGKEDYQAYLGFLSKGLEKYGCELHAYSLMPDETNLLVTPKLGKDISALMQYVGRHYGPYYNKKYGERGPLWKGRFKSNIIEADNYLLKCMRYIELKPIVAGLANRPARFKWSSYSFNAQGKENPILTIHSEYKNLHRIAVKRQEAYIEFSEETIDQEESNFIEACCSTGTPLGDASFKRKVEKKLKVKVGYERRGRPW